MEWTSPSASAVVGGGSSANGYFDADLVVKGKRDPLFYFRPQLGNNARNGLAPLFETQFPKAWALIDEQFFLALGKGL